MVSNIHCHKILTVPHQTAHGKETGNFRSLYVHNGVLEHNGLKREAVFSAWVSHQITLPTIPMSDLDED